MRYSLDKTLIKDPLILPDTMRYTVNIHERGATRKSNSPFNNPSKGVNAMLAQTTATSKTQNPYEYPLSFNPNGSINWEATLNAQTLAGWALYDAQSAPKLYNPAKGLLVRLPQRLSHHTFQYVALDDGDGEVSGAYELKTLLEGIESQDCQPLGEPLEF